jgi:hypothetical protein
LIACGYGRQAFWDDHCTLRDVLDGLFDDDDDDDDDDGADL